MVDNKKKSKKCKNLCRLCIHFETYRMLTERITACKCPHLQICNADCVMGKKSVKSPNCYDLNKDGACKYWTPNDKIIAKERFEKALDTYYHYFFEHETNKPLIKALLVALQLEFEEDESSNYFYSYNYNEMQHKRMRNKKVIVEEPQKKQKKKSFWKWLHSD